MTCLRRSTPGRGRTTPVEVHELRLWEVYCPDTARIVATFECREEATEYARRINQQNTPQQFTGQECCQNG